MSHRTRSIARQGELIVFDALPSARWVNENAESGERYDILWKHVKIDVKTTLQTAYTTKKSFQFFDSSAPKKEPMIFVFVALYQGERYFWVEGAINHKRAFYKKSKDSLTLKDLPKAIRKCYKETKKIYSNLPHSRPINYKLLTTSTIGVQ